jgi:hypothetical protein
MIRFPSKRLNPKDASGADLEVGSNLNIWRDQERICLLDRL